MWVERAWTHFGAVASLGQMSGFMITSANETASLADADDLPNGLHICLGNFPCVLGSGGQRAAHFGRVLG
jgi:hypothetical protein